jgi:iron complex outermembrane receptor protein
MNSNKLYSNASCLTKASIIAFIISISAISSLAQSGVGSPDSVANSQSVVLPTFEVSSTQDNGYRASNSVSATRINTAIKDLPFSITAFTQQFIHDTGAQDLMSIATYSAGVTSGSREFNAGSQVFSIRGFLQAPEHDGFYESQYGNIYIDPVTIERVEVVKGPSSLLYGSTQPGGTVNYITKRAQQKSISDFIVEGGSAQYGRLQFDINRAIIDDKLLFRLNAAETYEAQFANPSKSQTTVVSPTVTWNVGSRVSVVLTAQYLIRSESPPALYYPNVEIATPTSIVSSFNTAAGSPSPSAALTNKIGIDALAGYQDAADPGYLPYYRKLPTSFNYSADSDHRESKNVSYNVEVDTKVTDHWVDRTNFDYNTNFSSQLMTGINAIYLAPPGSLQYNGTAWSVAPSWTALTTAQQLAAYQTFANQILSDNANAFQTQNGTPAPAVLPRRVRLQNLSGHTINAQSNLAGLYKLNGATLKPLFGVTYEKVYNNSTTQQTSGNATIPYYKAWDVNPQSPTYYINHESYTQTAITSAIAPSTYNQSFISDAGVFGMVNASFFNDRLLALFGERYARFETQTTTVSPTTGISTVGRGLRASAATPQVGLGYKVLPDLMVYSSFSEGFSIPTQAFTQGIQNINGVYSSVIGNQSSAVTSKQYEIGAKTDFLNGRISSTLAVYQIDQNNNITQLNQVINGVTYVQIIQGTNVRAKGAEFEVNWSPTDNLQVFASVSEEDIRNVAEPVGYLYYLGAHPQNSAKTLANLWARYNFTNLGMKNLWVGAGFNYKSPSLGDNKNPALYLDGYCLYNSAFGYSWTAGTTRMSTTLNWQNMTNIVYQPANQVRGLPGRAVLSLEAKF